MQSSTPLPPASDPRNQQAPPPHWSTVAITILTILAGTLGGLVAQGSLPAESTLGRIVVALAGLCTAAAAAIAAIWGQAKKERVVADGAAKIGLMEAQRNTTLTFQKPDIDKLEVS